MTMHTPLTTASSLHSLTHSSQYLRLNKQQETSLGVEINFAVIQLCFAYWVESWVSSQWEITPLGSVGPQSSVHRQQNRKMLQTTKKKQKKKLCTACIWIDTGCMREANLVQVLYCGVHLPCRSPPPNVIDRLRTTIRHVSCCKTFQYTARPQIRACMGARAPVDEWRTVWDYILWYSCRIHACQCSWIQCCSSQEAGGCSAQCILHRSCWGRNEAQGSDQANQTPGCWIETTKWASNVPKHVWTSTRSTVWWLNPPSFGTESERLTCVYTVSWYASVWWYASVSIPITVPSPVGGLAPWWKYDGLAAQPLQYHTGVVWAQVDRRLQDLPTWGLAREARHLMTQGKMAQSLLHARMLRHKGFVYRCSDAWKWFSDQNLGLTKAQICKWLWGLFH